jgi:hypothetical protein
MTSVSSWISGCSFQKKHGSQDWEASLQKAASTADTIVVTIHGGCEIGETPPVVTRISGSEQVLEFLNLIEVQHYDGRSLTFCRGKDTISFVHEAEDLATLYWTPGNLFSWRETGWSGDAALSVDSIHRIAHWLESHGVSYFAEELATLERRQREQEQADQKFVSSFPQNVQPIILVARHHNGEIDAKHVIAMMSSPRDVMVAACRALGSLDASEANWSMTVPLTRAVIAMAHQCPPAALWDAVAACPSDKQFQAGAARLIFSEGIGQLTPENQKDWISIAITALSEGTNVNKPPVMRILTKASAPEVDQLLFQIADGQIGSEITPGGLFFDEPGIRSSAALGLAQRHIAVSHSDWARWKDAAHFPQDTAAFSIADFIRGSRDSFDADIFKLKSFTLGIAAIDALLPHQKESHALGLLVAAMEHPWRAVSDYAERSLKEITGIEADRGDTRREIEKWLAAHPDRWRDVTKAE